MEMVTASLGRRMDRWYDEAVGVARTDGTGDKVPERLAPMLG